MMHPEPDIDIDLAQAEAETRRRELEGPDSEPPEMTGEDPDGPAWTHDHPPVEYVWWCYPRGRIARYAQCHAPAITGTVTHLAGHVGCEYRIVDQPALDADAALLEQAREGSR